MNFPADLKGPFNDRAHFKTQFLFFASRRAARNLSGAAGVHALKRAKPEQPFHPSPAIIPGSRP